MVTNALLQVVGWELTEAVQWASSMAHGLALTATPVGPSPGLWRASVQGAIINETYICHDLLSREGKPSGLLTQLPLQVEGPGASGLSDVRVCSEQEGGPLLPLGATVVASFTRTTGPGRGHQWGFWVQAVPTEDLDNESSEPLPEPGLRSAVTGESGGI